MPRREDGAVGRCRSSREAAARLAAVLIRLEPSPIAADVDERQGRRAQRLNDVQIYFDTNIYSYVVERGEAAEFVAWLDQECHEVILSDAHLGETLALRDAAIRDARLKLLHAALWTSARRGTPKTPAMAGQLLADEFVSEVGRRRPGWLHPFPTRGRIDVYLRRHRQRWSSLRKPPRWLTDGADRYLAVTNWGIEANRNTQKQLRQQALEDARSVVSAVSLGGRDVAIPQLDERDDLDAWRLLGIGTWFAALYSRVPSSRDLFDFASPYLRIGSVPRRELVEFWLTEAQPAQMPRSLLASLIGTAQLSRRITRGNAVDAVHGTFALDADAVVTADGGFSDALHAAGERLLNLGQVSIGKPVLVDRSGPSAVAEIRRALERT